MSKETKTRLLPQIIVGVVIALLVGSSAPWWWGEIFGPEIAETEEELPLGTQASDNELLDGPEQPSSDFSGGTRRSYSADFSLWPVSNSENGSVSLGFGNSYVMAPSSNTWIGSGRLEIPILEGDFVFDLRFKLLERQPSASLNFDLTGSGSDAESLNIFFTVWNDDSIAYTITKGRVRSGGGLAVPHGITEETIVEREQLSSDFKDHDWSKGSELSLKREGGNMQFFVNDRFVREFAVSLFPIAKISIAAAFKSKVLITSIEAREKG